MRLPYWVQHPMQGRCMPCNPLDGPYAGRKLAPAEQGEERDGCRSIFITIKWLGMEKVHVCPWYIGYFLLNPLRKAMQSPEEILGAYVKEGMQVIDYGSAMGFFSLPMAKMVGPSGRVVCYDVQEIMLRKLAARARKAGLEGIIEPRLVDGKPVLKGEGATKADFALLFAVAHEVPDKDA